MATVEKTNDLKIGYSYSLKDVTADMLPGFFVGWINPPSAENHFELLRNSDEIVLAIDEKKERIVGFITAITDKMLSAYIPFLEVLPEYQNCGIGQELARRMLEKLNEFYMIDLLCDSDLQPFYEKLQMKRANGMMKRNYERQSGCK